MVNATYDPPVVVYPTGQPAQISALASIYASNYPYETSTVVNLVDPVTGAFIEDLTQYVGLPDVAGQAANQIDTLSIADVTVSYDSTAELPESIAFTLIGRTLQWGSDCIAVYQLIRCHDYADNAWQGFPLGHYIVTTPGTGDLNDPDVVDVRGYSKNYLLQSQPQDSIAFAVGYSVADAVRDVFRKSSLIAPTATLASICNYPAIWAAALPGGHHLAQPYSAPLGVGKTFLQIINELLALSGCQPLFVDQSGNYTIALTYVPAMQPIEWRWAGDLNSYSGDAFPFDSIVLDAGQTYAADVYNVANRFIFIQDGLTFQPVEGSGQYTVNNLTNPPSDQTSTGRILVAVILLQATGQADLKTQGDAYVTKQYASAQTITLDTLPWPVAWYFDVFQFSHSNLPGTQKRVVQAQQWTLPLTGDDPMQWTTTAVANI